MFSFSIQEFLEAASGLLDEKNAREWKNAQRVSFIATILLYHKILRQAMEKT